MITSIKAEFRKILTIRSTYIILLFALLMIGLFAFYGQGLKFGDSAPRNMPDPVVPPDYLMHAVRDAVNALAIFIALIGVLLMTHEYRYNTIVYTLTSNTSRSRTLVAKILAIIAVSLVLAFLFGTLSPIATLIGLKLNGAEMMPQVFYFKDLLWQVALYGWGFAMAGLLIAVLIRNQIGVIVTLLLFPTTVESLLSFILKDNAYYLPFLALGTVINHNDAMSEHKGALVFLGYLVVGWIIGWILFVRRDAN